MFIINLILILILNYIFFHHVKCENRQLLETKDNNNDNNNNNNNNNDCPYKFKVFVYPLPQSIDSVRIGAEARVNRTLHICQKCILEQFSLEYIIEDFFINTCARTLKPSEADFFYLPLLRDAEFRTHVYERRKQARAPSTAEKALLDLLEKNDSRRFVRTFNTSASRWYRHRGADHVIVMPAPVTNLRHESSQRGFFHYRRHLFRPIFIALEYSKSFIESFPICSKHKNILVPYPTTDPDLFNGTLHKRNEQVSRSSLLYYAGGVHGDCVEVRRAMKFLLQNSSKLPSVVAPVPSNMHERERGFASAVFCPIPVGDSPSSKRMYDVLNFGCIPVVISDDLVWALSSDSGGLLEPKHFSLTIPQIVVQLPAEALLDRYKNNTTAMGVLPVSGMTVYDILKFSMNKGGNYWKGHYVNALIQILMRIPRKDIAYLQAGVQAAAPHYRYYSMSSGVNDHLDDIPTAVHRYPDGGATHAIAQLLDLRLKRGITTVADDCDIEREKERPMHKYEWRYPCDYDAGSGRPWALEQQLLQKKQKQSKVQEKMKKK